MNTNSLTTDITRRDFARTLTKATAVSALAGVALPHVHAAGSDTITLALVGAGGRGTGAASDAMSVTGPPTKLVAIADVSESQLNGSLNGLKNKHAEKVDVPKDRQFIGFDGYKNAIDSLAPGGVAIFTTPLAFRWVHFQYAIAKGVNVFMEKPVIGDGPSARKMYALAEDSEKRGLKVGVGLMSRHSRSLQELHERIQEDIGDITLMRAYRMAGPLASAFSEKWPGKPKEPSELLWQIKRFHSFLWASGGCFSDFYIHHIDHCCWMKNAWPVKAHAIGGRHYRDKYVDQNFDSYSVEYTFADGSKFIMDGRCMVGAVPMYNSFAHGTKGLAVISKHGDCGTPSMTFKGQNMDRTNMIWQSKDNSNPYQNEWNALVAAIRENKPHNEAKRGVDASVATALGRMAAHTGQELTWEDFLNSDHAFAPNADKMTMDGPPPVASDKDGKYPVPQPGVKRGATWREYYV